MTSVLVGIIAGALLAGVVVDRVVVARLRALSRTQGWTTGEIVARALSGTTVIYFVLAGAAVAARRAELAQPTLRIVETTLMVLAIVTATFMTTRLVSGLIRGYTQRADAVVPSSTIFVNLARLGVIAVGVLLALNVTGVSITPLLTALGVGGLAVALGLQETLSNLFAGLQLIGSRQIQPGDFIRLESGEEGEVEDITWRYTTIRQLSNNSVVIPNSKLANSLLTVFSRPAPEMSVLVNVGVSYASDLEHVERVTIETATEVMRAVDACPADFTPLVRFLAFGDSAVEMRVVLRVSDYAHQYVLTHEFVKALHRRFAEEGIEIPFPQRVVSMRQEPGTATDPEARSNS